MMSAVTRQADFSGPERTTYSRSAELCMPILPSDARIRYATPKSTYPCKFRQSTTQAVWYDLYMGFESFKKSKLEIAAAAALAASNPASAEASLPYMPIAYETASVTSETTEEQVSPVDTEVIPEKIALENLPTPKSPLETLNEAQLADFKAGIERYRALAASDKNEHSAVFIVNKDGSTRWEGQKIILRLIQDNMMQMIVPERIVENDSMTILIDVHTHPTKMAEDVLISTEAKQSIPPSNTDILGSLSIPATNSIKRERLVVTESGMWRYGPKSSEAAKVYEAIVQAGNEKLDVLKESRMQLQADIFIQKIYQTIINSGIKADTLILHGIDSLRDTTRLREVLSTNIETFISLYSVSEYLKSEDDEFLELGISEFVDVLESVYKSKVKVLAEVNPGASLETLIGSPEEDGAFSQKIETNEDFSKPPPLDTSWDTYRDDWRQFGVYIEPVILK